MKRFNQILLLLFVSCAAFAQSPFEGYPSNGFYRVQNYGTGRYAYVLDNTGSLDYATMDAEMGAIELHRDTARLHYDPASVIFIRQIDAATHKYNIEAQGTGVYQLIQHYVETNRRSNGTFWVYASSNGVTKYLGELDNQNNPNLEGSYLSTNRQGAYIQWNVIPLGYNGDYFGILPTVQVGNAYYRPFYASFAIDLQNTGLRAYYINKVYRSAAIFSEITGKVPPYTPVYIECAGPNHYSNRVNIEEGTNLPSITGNKLKGNFFCNPNRKAYSRDAQVAYNPVTMRVLTATADGQLCFAKVSGLSYLPANESYLEVPSSADDTLRIMTEEEYAVYSLSTAINIEEDSLLLYPGGTSTLHATITPSSAAIRTPVWQSTNTQIAEIDSLGQCTAKAVGTTYIIASTQDGTNLSDTCLIRVRPILATNIMLNKTYVSAKFGDSIQLSATVFPANATNPNVEWHSTNHGVASLVNGLVRVIGYGTDTIRVSTTDGSNLEAQCIVFCHAPAADDVILSAPTTIYVGDTFHISYQIVPDMADARIYRWTESSRGRIISIDSTGTCIANAAGSVTITAYIETSDGFTSTTRFSRTMRIRVSNPPTLAESLQLASDTMLIGVGEQQVITYSLLPSNTSQKELLWTSSDSSIAIAAGGVVSGIAVGNATIYVTTTDGSNLTDSCIVQVSNTTQTTDSVFVSSISLSSETNTLLIGDTLHLTAVITPLNATNPAVKWYSNAPEILNIDSTGRCIALSVGTVVVTAIAADGHGAIDSIEIEVEPILINQIVLNMAEANCFIGDSIQLTANVYPADATFKLIHWTSSDSSVVSVEDGACVALKEGTAIVRAVATDGSQISSSCRFVVSAPYVASLEIGIEGSEQTIESLELTIHDSIRLQAVIRPSNARKDVIWESTDPNIISIENGLCRAMQVGEADVICTTLDGSLLSAQCHVVVTPVYVEQIVLSAEYVMLYIEENSKLTANVFPKEATIQTLLWSSSDESVVMVSNEGNLVGVAEGQATVTAAATDGSNVSASCEIEVRLFTALEDILSQPAQHTIFDIMGRRIYSITHSGLYIIDNKVVYVIGGF